MPFCNFPFSFGLDKIKHKKPDRSGKERESDSNGKQDHAQ